MFWLPQMIRFGVFCVSHQRRLNPSPSTSKLDVKLRDRHALKLLHFNHFISLASQGLPRYADERFLLWWDP